jgi:hypothetical protein
MKRKYFLLKYHHYIFISGLHKGMIFLNFFKKYSMQNDSGPKQPSISNEDNLHTPQPPKNVFVEMPEMPEAVAMEDHDDSQNDINSKENETPIPAEKVQDYDWNNGKPEVTPELVETLPSHQNPEVSNDKSLRENKGEKPGDDSFEASEEVNTGQSGG